MKITVFTLILTISALTAEYGRITGKVIDQKTGKPLVGAGVIIQGTQLETPTDTLGNYVIDKVPFGTYTVVASIMSYELVEHTNVVVDGTHTPVLNFSLSRTKIYKTINPVVGIEPYFDISQTKSMKTITSIDIKRLPVTTIDELLRIQPGVVRSDLGLHLRGGRANEIAYYVDGIATTARPTISAIEELQIISSGFDAECDDALSGIVNIVMRDGTGKTHGSVQYLTDEVFSGSRALNFGYNRSNFTLQGPLPEISRLRYFFSGDLMFTDAFQEAGYKLPSPREDYNIYGRLTYLLRSARGRVSLSGFSSRDQYVVWSPYTEPGNNLKYTDTRPMTRTKQWFAVLSLDYMLTNRTMATIRLGMTHYDRAYGNRDYAWEDSVGRQWYEDYRLKAEHLIDYLVDKELRKDLNLTIRELMTDTMMMYHEPYESSGQEVLRKSPYGIEGLFYSTGDYPAWEYARNKNLQARLSLTHRIRRHHTFKIGLDVTRYNLKSFLNELPWHDSPLWDYYERTPYKIGGYIQDDIRFGSLAARLGMRLNYFNPQIKYPSQWWWPPLPDTIFTYETNLNISPRIGLAFPVNNRLKFRFNYGNYYQIQTYLLPEPMKTVMYELGVETLPLKDVFFGITAYFKTMYDLGQLRILETSQEWPLDHQYFHTEGGNVHGLEVTMLKSMSALWELGITYNLQYAEGAGVSGGEWPEYEYQTDIPNGYWFDFDQRHTVNAYVNLEFPQDFFLFPLQYFTSSVVVSYNAGHPYTPEDLRGNPIGYTNSQRLDGSWNVDWKLSRRMRLGPAKVVFSGLLFNLFNTEQVIDVYKTTGKPDEHGYPDPPVDQFDYVSMTSTRYSPQADHDHNGLISPAEMQAEYVAAQNDYFTDPTNYRYPLRLRLGLGIEF